MGGGNASAGWQRGRRLYCFRDLIPGYCSRPALLGHHTKGGPPTQQCPHLFAPLSLTAPSAVFLFLFVRCIKPPTHRCRESRSFLHVLLPNANAYFSPLVVEMFFSSSLSLGLLASAVAVNAAIWDIQVGDSTGALHFSPEAIVSLEAIIAGILDLTLQCRLLFLVTKLSSTSTRRTTPRPNLRSQAHVLKRLEVSTPDCTFVL